jgi:hypothetical protein
MNDNRTPNGGGGRNEGGTRFQKAGPTVHVHRKKFLFPKVIFVFHEYLLLGRI